MNLYRGAIDIDGEDPGRGDPADVRGAAGRRRTAADVSMEAATQVGAVPNEAGQWRGAFAQVMTAETQQHAAELAVIAEQWRSDASALEMYAATVQDIAARYQALRSRYRNAKYDLAVAQNQVTEFLSVTERQAPVSTSVTAAEARLRTLGAQYQDLLLERQATDNLAVILLTSTDARGGLAQLGAGAIGGSSVPTLAELAGMDRSDLATLLRLNPDLLAQLTAANPPENVAAWWGSLDETHQTSLVLGASGVVGALGGIPPLARIAANRINAALELVKVDEQISVLESTIDQLHDTGINISVYQQQLGDRQNERSYLAGAVAGTVQLYLYDKDGGNVIEMIGTLDAETTRVLTYTPGTFTNMQSFYDRSTQPVSVWITNNVPNTVAFVWKDGKFPGQDLELGNPLGILEANAPQLAVDTGAALAAFQTELRMLPSLEGATSVAMGHSWGLAATTGSEVAGAQYDQVHSLAGAWMPVDWEESQGTSYNHWSYRDFLSFFQDLGVVGLGNVPDSHEAFESHVYSREGDWDIAPPMGYPHNVPVETPPGFPMTTRPFENHDVIAREADNQRTLEDIKAVMER